MMPAERQDQHRTAPPPSGQQFEITQGDQHATVVEVGGGLRQYSVGGRDLLDGYGLDDRCTGARGLPLIPWPNRIRDGEYTFDAVRHQLPLTEPSMRNAIHGLLRWRNWSCVHHSVDEVTMRSVLRPMMGYPFTLDVDVTYRLSSAGLSVRTKATNAGDRTCPYGAGQHPYLTVGTTLVDPCQVQLDAEQYLPTDDRGLPTRIAEVDGTAFDFRGGRVIGTQSIDLTYTRLARDADGQAWARLTAPNGRETALWADENYPFLELYTSHTQPFPHMRTGLGVEPMTCAPNAFVTGQGLIRLEPGQSTSASWGLTGS